MHFNSLEDVAVAISLIEGDDFEPNMSVAMVAFLVARTGDSTCVYGSGGMNRYMVTRLERGFSLALSKGHLSGTDLIDGPILERAAEVGIPLFDSAGVYPIRKKTGSK